MTVSGSVGAMDRIDDLFLFFNLVCFSEKRRKVRLMTSPCRLSVSLSECLPLIGFKQIGTFHEILQGGHATEGYIDATFP